ncbi:hypothetical protein Q9R19_01065 [Microbacterium sp. ARD32]|uniref:hypothetical protein n=1 Tax=Microbacterium sp. ARD32 TaxID=2962577 RepID=UPI002881B1BB|nr:hypothetical protein [Microbacterium sp. ARD32]MDT0156206.1 hypothetical protein [Microbacterium sp. ARD32]
MLNGAASADDLLDVDPMMIPTIMALAVIVFVVLRRLRPTKVRPVGLILLPVIVLLFGVAIAVPAAMPWPILHPIDAAVLLADLAVSVGLGVARGNSIRIDSGADGIRYRYTAPTVALWAASIAARFAIGTAGAALGAVPLLTSAAVLGMLGLSLISQNSTLLVRIRRSGAGRAAQISASTGPSWAAR